MTKKVQFVDEGATLSAMNQGSWLFICSCHRKLRTDWTYCPYCGKEITSWE